MAHAHTQIRGLVVTALTGLATAGSNVRSTRVYPHGDSMLPGYAVSNGFAEVDLENETIGQRQIWEFNVMIEARSKPADGTELDDELDQLVAEAQAALMADNTLGNAVIWSELREIETEVSGELERPVGIARMKFVTRYAILAGDPETLIYLP